MIDDKTKLETITSEFEKSQKNIPPIWVGEGWYKSVPNSFNYFASGFEAGLSYQCLTTEEIKSLSEILDMDAVQRETERDDYIAEQESILRNLLERINK